MTKIISLLSILIFVSSCVDMEITIRDNRLEEYYQNFIDEGQDRGFYVGSVNLTLEVVPNFDDRGQLGRCKRRERVFGSERTVYIHENIVAFHDEGYNYYLEQIVFHELGHCLLGRSDTDSEESIMITGGRIPTDLYRADRSKYLDELFN